MKGFLLAALALVLASVGARAADCVPTTSQPEVTLPVGALYGSMVYIDNDPCQPSCLFSVWYYEEYNEIAGLQRDDDMVDDTCDGLIMSDAWQF